MDRMLSDTRRASIVAERLPAGPKLTQPVTFHYEIHRHTTRMRKLTKAFKVYRLTVLTFVCVAASLVIGLVSRPYAKDWTERQFMYIEFPGELYLRLLKLIIIPLLVSNVILSFGTMQRKLSSHFGKVACFLYLGSNLMAITTAILMALIICPGKQVIEGQSSSSNSNKPPRITIQLDNHHHFNEYHDSMKRYREYHPMFFHTDMRGAGDEHSLNFIQLHYFVTNGYNNKNQKQTTNSMPQQQMTTFAPEMIHNIATSTAQIDIPPSSSSSITNYSNIKRIKNPNTIDDSSSSNSNNNNNPFKNIPKALGPILDSSKNKTINVKPPTIVKPQLQTTNQTNPDSRPVVKYPGSGGGAGNISLIDGDHHRLGGGLNSKLPIDVLLDVIRNLVPDSIIGATLQTTRTRLFAPKELIISINGTTEPSPSRWPMGHEMLDQANIIGLLAISVLTGVVLSHMEEAAKPMLDLCACISELSLRIGMVAINLTPFCIMFLLIGQVARTRDLSSVAGELCMYTVTMLIALLLHGFVLLPLIYYLVTRKSPISFLFNMHEALVAAFATSSSSASMALMMKCLGKMELNPVIVGAFGPLSSVFNMNGTTIYETIGGIFIAQTLGVSLPLTSLLLVGLSAAVASFSTSGIPSSGMMTMVIVLNAINLPVLQLSLIYIVDFIIDRFRTVINVWSGSIVCALINHICPEHLFEELMKQSEKYREKRTSLGTRRVSDEEEHHKPKVISVTITPPTENSHI